MLLCGALVQVASAAPAGEIVSLNVGESATVTLPGNPTTGFVWSVVASSAVVQVELSYERRPAPSGPPVCGRPCGTVVTLTGKQAGQGEVKLIYARPWEKGNAPSDTRTITVTVK